MSTDHLETILKGVKEALKNMDLRDGDMFSISDEHHRVHISPYRLTMELRFPNGLHKTDQ